MTNSNSSLSKPSNSPRTWVVFGALISAVVGFGDALYLTLTHYQQVIPPCSFGSCEAVLTSRFATLGGVPISLVGLAGYALIAFLLLLYIDRRWAKVLRVVAILALASFVVSIVLVALQLFVLKAICLYCMVSAICDIALFLFTIPFWKSRHETA